MILSMNCYCLIPFLVCYFRSSVKKTASAMRTGSQEAERRFLGFGWLTLTQHMWRLVLGRQRGSSPVGQVTQSSQGLTTTIWPHLPRSLPLQVSMASTWRPTISDITSSTQKYTFIKLMHTQSTHIYINASTVQNKYMCTHIYAHRIRNKK